MKITSGVLFIVLIFFSCSSTRSLKISSKSRLQLFGQFEIPPDASFNQTKIGGISGIDYDPVQDIYFLISDDPSQHNPSRFYTAKIEWNINGIENVRIIGVDSLRQKNGQLYPSAIEDKQAASDPESIRYDALRKQIIWTSEGERILNSNEEVLQDPAIHVADRNGRELFTYTIPENFKASREEKGSRHNSSFEGACFDNDYRHAYIAMEAPLLEDGPLAGTGDSTALVRIIQFDAASGHPLAQFAYRTDPVAVLPNPPGSFKINGITEILYVEKQKILVLERSYSTGKKDCVVKIYLADLSSGTDVSKVGSLIKEVPVPLKKELLLNSDSLGIFVDNVEGICWGPRLPDGRQTLVLIVDNNFSPTQRPQVLVLTLE
jgi:hypothetical protein